MTQRRFLTTPGVTTPGRGPVAVGPFERPAAEAGIMQDRAGASGPCWYIGPANSGRGDTATQPGTVIAGSSLHAGASTGRYGWASVEVESAAAAACLPA